MSTSLRDKIISKSIDKSLEQISENKTILNIIIREEIEKLKEQREKEINASLVKLNNDIYQNEKGLGENDRVYLVV